MKTNPWFVGGLALAAVSGIAYLLVGWLRPGRPEIPQHEGGVFKSALAEAKTKIEAIRQKQASLHQRNSGFKGMTGSEGEHRVFVSTTLVYLPKSAEPVQTLDRKMKTDDGIEIGWKMRYGFDPADPSVGSLDPDGDGFSNLEEYLANPQTDPLRKEDSPAKESKLKSRAADPLAMTVSFPEKSGGTFTLRFQVGTKRREYKGKPGQSCWVMAGSSGLEVYAEEQKMKAAREKAKSAGQGSHVIPVNIVSYEEKVQKIKDAKAGGIEVEVDNSEIILERKDALAERQTLTFSTPQRPQSLSWDVGEIRFFTPVSGGKELGPFQVGETFSFEGNDFSILGREGKKIRLSGKNAEGGEKTFWVPPESEVPAAVGKP